MRKLLRLLSRQHITFSCLATLVKHQEEVLSLHTTHAIMFNVWNATNKRRVLDANAKIPPLMLFMQQAQKIKSMFGDQPNLNL